MKALKKFLITTVSMMLVVLSPFSTYAIDEETLFFYALNNILFFDPDNSCEMGGGNNYNYNGESIFSSAELEAIEANRPFYEKAADKNGFPWQILAVIHSVEHNSLRSNPENGQGAYQLYSYTRKGNTQELDPDKAFLPAGEIDDEEFQRQTDIAAEVIANKASGLNLGTDAGVKRLFFLYNGAANAYVEQAKALGFSDEEAKNGEGSPYVMNRFDEKRDPSVEPTKSNGTWGQIKEDGKGMVYPANLHFGTFIMYVALGGSTHLCNNSPGGLVSGGMTLAEAQEFMSYYYNKAVENINNKHDVILDGAHLYYYESCTSALTNCVAFSQWFLAKYTTLGDVGLPDGKNVVSRLVNMYHLIDGGTTPRPYAIFSRGGSEHGHTGVILGVDEAKGTVIIGEAACTQANPLSKVKVSEHSLSEYASGTYTYAYTDSILKGI